MSLVSSAIRSAPKEQPTEELRTAGWHHCPAKELYPKWWRAFLQQLPPQWATNPKGMEQQKLHSPQLRTKYIHPHPHPHPNQPTNQPTSHHRTSSTGISPFSQGGSRGPGMASASVTSISAAANTGNSTAAASIASDQLVNKNVSKMNSTKVAWTLVNVFFLEVQNEFGGCCWMLYIVIGHYWMLLDVLSSHYK